MSWTPSKLRQNTNAKDNSFGGQMLAAA